LHFGGALQLWHAPPDFPQAAAVVPALHVPFSQQPPLQKAVALQLVVHVFALHAMSGGQSALVLQPQTSVPRHTVPVEDVMQLAQVPVPHALFAVPGAHWPLEQQPEHVPSPAPPQAVVQAPPVQVGVSAVHVAQAPPPPPHAENVVPVVHIVPSQQPPLHPVRPASPPQLVVHAPVARSHAMPDGQSVATVQDPHALVTRHVGPASVVEQSVQDAPLVPHALAAVPAAHMWFAPQHPEQVPLPPPPQAAVQPITPMGKPTHVGVSPPHTLQAAPPFPHALLALPLEQVPFSQQPFMHAVNSPASPPQLGEQVFVARLHACCPGQSIAETHWPHVPLTHFDVIPVHMAQLPAEPHCIWVVPGTHWLFASQQPPWHGDAVLHEALQAPWTHALPTGQSASLRQPPVASVRPVSAPRPDSG
jgi:hypothetical protein